ncbi:hypothetical protein NLJ89_g1012 [Agrocybe chaxingu]|uniref:Methyltransferase type 11 domain-containing protein n=1 Tax=Agrocybe chaxingu TaxID=84603 RepID=A0A9W8N0Y7_9AGAR|nr:hypothetical protein NLJ89_g1012 [Agrocybe chaxingu]
MSGIHKVAQSGFGTGTNELYDRARPSYQQFALDHIRDSVKSKEPLNIVEIGSGTGIFTRALLADPEWNQRIKQLQAVEPSEGMRDIFSKTVKDDRVTVSEGAFASTHAEDSWADLVVIAQAFHWCPDYGAACLEFSRILKPGGSVAFIWNLEDRDSAEWVGRIRDHIEVHEQGTPQFRHMYWRQTFDTPEYQSEFEPHKEQVWTYHLQGTKETVVDRALSKSYIAILPPDKKTKVQDEIRKIIDDSHKTWIDKSKGIFEYPYKTHVVVAYKRQK